MDKLTAVAETGKRGVMRYKWMGRTSATDTGRNQLG
jgi:hypothetical protein